VRRPHRSRPADCPRIEAPRLVPERIETSLLVLPPRTRGATPAGGSLVATPSSAARRPPLPSDQRCVLSPTAVMARLAQSVRDSESGRPGATRRRRIEASRARAPTASKPPALPERIESARLLRDRLEASHPRAHSRHEPRPSAFIDLADHPFPAATRMPTGHAPPASCRPHRIEQHATSPAPLNHPRLSATSRVHRSAKGCPFPPGATRPHPTTTRRRGLTQLHPPVPPRAARTAACRPHAGHARNRTRAQPGALEGRSPSPTLPSLALRSRPLPIPTHRGATNA
jgi:hypothetical protein